MQRRFRVQQEHVAQQIRCVNAACFQFARSRPRAALPSAPELRRWRHCPPFLLSPATRQFSIPGYWSADQRKTTIRINLHGFSGTHRDTQPSFPTAQPTWIDSHTGSLRLRHSVVRTTTSPRPFFSTNGQKVRPRSAVIPSTSIRFALGSSIPAGFDCSSSAGNTPDRAFMLLIRSSCSKRRSIQQRRSAHLVLPRQEIGHLLLLPKLLNTLADVYPSFLDVYEKSFEALDPNKTKFPDAFYIGRKHRIKSARKKR